VSLSWRWFGRWRPNERKNRRKLGEEINNYCEPNNQPTSERRGRNLIHSLTHPFDSVLVAGKTSCASLIIRLGKVWVEAKRGRRSKWWKNK
jgi:hypothetical protein